MVLTRGQLQAIIHHINNINTNQQVQIMEDPVNYLLIPFENNINLGDPLGIRLYLQATN